MNIFPASQFNAEVLCILFLIFNYLAFTEVSLGKPKYISNTMFNSEQHKVQKNVHSDAVANIGSCSFRFRFMYLLTQPMLVRDPVFRLLSQRTWAVTSISQR